MDSVLKRNNVVIQGKGEQVIMFAHGFGCDQTMWRFIAPEFLEHYKVVLFDYTGSGRSEITHYDPQKYSKLEGYAQDIVDICAECQFTDVILVGHSVSATIALLATLQSPQYFSRLIHLSPSPSFLNDPPDYMGGFNYEDLEELLVLLDSNYIGWASYLAPIVIGGQASDALTGELADSFCSTDPIIAKNFAIATFLADHRVSYTKSTVPSLIIQSKVDSLAAVGVGEYLQRTTPMSEMVIIDSEGHCPHMTHPALVNKEIKNYLDNG